MELILKIDVEAKKLQELLNYLKTRNYNFLLQENETKEDDQVVRTSKKIDKEKFLKDLELLKQIKSFQKISDPVQWQRDLRSEWE